MEVAVANPSVNPVSAGMIPPDPQAGRAGDGGRASDELSQPRRARRGGAGEEDERQGSGRELVPRTQTALYTSQAARGIAVYQDTAGFSPYQTPTPTAGIDLYA